MRAEREIDRWSEMDAVLPVVSMKVKLIDLCSYPQLWSRNITELIVAVITSVRSSG